MNITTYERCQTMHEGSVEDLLIGLTKPSVDRLLKMQAPADCIALYTYYCYIRKWQKNTTIRATSDFAMKGLDMGRDRFARAKKQLVEAGFVEDVPHKNEDGHVERWYVKVKYALNATLATFQEGVHPTENPQGGESVDKYPKLINETPFNGSDLQIRNEEKARICIESKLKRIAKDSAKTSCPPDQTQADATAKGRTADAVIKNPTPNCASPLPELENNKAKVNSMFRRRDNTRWSDKELKALNNTLGTTEDEWDALIELYKHLDDDGYFCRQTPLACMNNWAGEIDKAKRGKPKVYPKGNESSPSAPKHTPSGHKLSGREEEFWAWLKAWRPYEKRCDIRSVREDYVYDFLNGVVHEPEEPVTEIKLPRVEEDLF